MDELVNESFNHLRNLARDIDNRITGTSSADQILRNEIAGMFAVTIAATYEGIVRETVINYASQFHSKYREYVQNDFERLNARVSIDDLKSYSLRFGLPPFSGPSAKKNQTIFHEALEKKRELVEQRYRADLAQSYRNLFFWRNKYAHERAPLATFSEVYNAHRVGQHVIRCFVKSFDTAIIDFQK